MSLNESDPEYNERELAEIEELNRLSDYNPEITQSKLWRRLTIFVAVVIVCSLLLPIAALIFNSSNSTTSGRDEVRTSTNIPTPNFELIDTNGHSIKLSTELENNPVVILIFYRGFFWGVCQSQLVELEKYKAPIKEAGGRLLAISVDDLSQAKAMQKATSASFPILSDAEKKVSNAYGVYNLLGDGVAAPSIFLISKDKLIGYYVGSHISDRIETSELLKILEEHTLKGRDA